MLTILLICFALCVVNRLFHNHTPIEDTEGFLNAMGEPDENSYS
jgi:hypothetical protein